MKKIILTLVFCFLFVPLCFAEKHYVFINNSDRAIDKGEEAGQNTKGDVVTITPFTPQYKPTRAELSSYKIVVLDLTDTEMNELLEPETEDIIVDGKIIGEKTIRARKRKVELSTLTLEQEKEIDKATIFDKVTVKPSLITAIISK